MYSIESTDFGLKLSFDGRISLEEAERLRDEFLDVLRAQEKPFSLMIDARRTIPLEPDAAEAIVSLHSEWRRECSSRAVVLVHSPVVRGQALQICFDSSRSDRDLVIDTSKDPQWETKAREWLTGNVATARSSRS